MSFQLPGASALLGALPGVLPPSKQTLETPQDGIAALLHTAFTALGFKLTGINENAPVRTFDGNVLPEDWNQQGPGHYTLRYNYGQGNSRLLVKVVKLGARTLISSIATESEKTATMDVPTDDLVSASSFPVDFARPTPQPLSEAFISSNRVDDFVSQFFATTTMRELAPRLPKEIQAERAETEAGASRLRVSDAATPARVQLPSREGPPRPSSDGVPAPSPPRGNPLEIGRRDLDPFPSNPFAPPPLFPGNRGDGMFVGPDHPIFSGGMRGGGLGGMGPWGGDGYLPPMGAPPGARFDPVGPGFGANPAFPGRSMPRGGGGPFGGQDPDNDDFPPPGSRDMFM